MRGASGVKTIYQRKRVNLHPTRYRRPFSQEKGQFVSKTRIQGPPLVSFAHSIGTSHFFTIWTAYSNTSTPFKSGNTSFTCTRNVCLRVIRLNWIVCCLLLFFFCKYILYVYIIHIYTNICILKVYIISYNKDLPSRAPHSSMYWKMSTAASEV